ncbi:MAG TPA: HD domain-containing protein [Pyrinomonadaceae bacterium]|nr:HD domain-containing protein [Chloracidobacterium sp.]MBP9934923.1 HD domain-containing protein [Pyrinomonadaceae bacterium]MBK7803351.1 HD domain-containing protein [Chloracidobacterium sp.]MBK9766649.1 HD domain-containing protein [Chloracidobacterium sp.]MBL0241124.1 HD domain-containing protein [Chloracidobacterium sp.]
MQSAPAENPKIEEKLLKVSSEMDTFEGYAETHAQRMASLADSIAVTLNVEPHDRTLLRQAVLIHDIGEVQMGREYISASRPLTDDERVDLQRHPVIGEQAASKLELSRAAQLVVRWHHEWWCGAGYPDALTGEEIPLAARILRVADTYAALVTSRPFRPAMSQEEARQYMVEWAGIEFDPAVIKAFLTPRS